MSQAAAHNTRTADHRWLSTLADDMDETLTAFTAYVHFESTDPVTNRWRFYDLRWQPTLFGEGALLRTWGRQGQAGTTRAAVYPDRTDAAATIRQVFRRRLQHGYTVVDWQ